MRISDWSSDVCSSDPHSLSFRNLLPRGEKDFSRHQQEFAIAFRAGDRAFDDAFDAPAQLRVHPALDARADFLMEGRVAHDTALAHALPADLELRLDEHCHHGPRRGPGDRKSTRLNSSH